MQIMIDHLTGWRPTVEQFYLDMKRAGRQTDSLTLTFRMLNTFHQVLVSHVTYSYAISQYANTAFLDKVLW